MESPLYLALASVFVHSILFVSIFDIYFTSPVDSGMEPQSYSMAPPAKRVVLFVADGLRADTIFSIDEEGNTPAPYLRDIIERRGRWGVSHTHVPTESRPGHVALIAGLYEDVSAVTRGWQENPVQFDSIFNRSKHTWSWGSPDILPMFSKGAEPGRVETFMYDASWEDFADSDASKLDWWVFDRVKKMFENAKVNRTLAEQLAADKNVFFLHLLGIDTNGHAHRPMSSEVINNLKYVDSAIREIVEIINSYFGDVKTAYVFTSDHGMTDWGSHGAGLPEETMTPLICWGAGIKHPRSNTYAELVYNDDWSEKWGLEKIERVDVEQADIAPLITTLFGGAIPINSEGVLPIHYIHYNKGFIATSIETNSRQLYEQVRVKEERIRSTSIPFLYRPFPKMLNAEMLAKQERIKSLLDLKQYQVAIDLSMNQIKIYKEAVKYYHAYHRSSLLLVLSLGFMGWMMCTFIHLLADLGGKSYQSSYSSGQGLPVKTFVLWCAACLLLLYQSSPILYYCYYTLTISCWGYAWRRRGTLLHVWELTRVNSTRVFKIMVSFVSVLCGLELLVVSFFYREVLSLVLIILAIWPYFTNLKQLKICVMWTAVCIALSIFPLLPIIGRNANYLFVIFAGITTSLACFSILSMPHLNYLLFSSSGYHWSRYLFGFQNLLLLVSSFIPAWTNWFFAQKESIPIVINLFSWFALISSVFSLKFGPNSLPGRLLHIFLPLYTTFILLSTSFEAVFVLLLCICLYLWLTIEDTLAPSHSKICSMWESVISFNPSKVVTIFPNEAGHRRQNVSLSDMWRVYICILLGLFSFFGTGNIASINTFDPSTVYCFLTVFSPFVMGGLILWKMVIPFIFVSCVFNVIISLTNQSLKSHLLLMLLMSDIMGLNFFFLVRDSGSWLQIGMSISHYVIMMMMIIGIIILIGVARILTGVALSSRKTENHHY